MNGAIGRDRSPTWIPYKDTRREVVKHAAKNSDS